MFFLRNVIQYKAYYASPSHYIKSIGEKAKINKTKLKITHGTLCKIL